VHAIFLFIQLFNIVIILKGYLLTQLHNNCFTRRKYSLHYATCSMCPLLFELASRYWKLKPQITAVNISACRLKAFFAVVQFFLISVVRRFVLHTYPSKNYPHKNKNWWKSGKNFDDYRVASYVGRVTISFTLYFSFLRILCIVCV
jgi:hypothetical protein